MYDVPMKRSYIGGLGLFAVLAALFIYANKGFLANQVSAFKLLPQPEPFTELYLTNVSGLLRDMPAGIKPGTTITFSFEIHNLEGRNKSYPYTVYILANYGTTTIASGTVELADTASVIIPESYTFKHAASSATVFISIPEQKQSLHFFVPNKE